jgi:hypothetical protein
MFPLHSGQNLTVASCRIETRVSRHGVQKAVAASHSASKVAENRVGVVMREEILGIRAHVDPTSTSSAALEADGTFRQEALARHSRGEL